MNLCIYKQLILNRGAKKIQRRQERLFIRWCWGKTPKHRRPRLHLLNKMNQNSKWKTWNCGATRRKHETIQDISVDFWMGPRTQSTVAKVGKWYNIKPRASMEQRRKPMVQRDNGKQSSKYWQATHLHKDSYPEYIRNSNNWTTKKQSI